MFVVLFHSVGSPFSVDIPCPEGPRNPGQFSPWMNNGVKTSSTDINRWKHQVIRPFERAGATRRLSAKLTIQAGAQPSAKSIAKFETVRPIAAPGFALTLPIPCSTLVGYASWSPAWNCHLLSKLFDS